jgi:hypothetical protein
VIQSTFRRPESEYTRSADADAYLTGNSFICMATTGQRDGFRAAVISPFGSSTGTVTKV